MFCMVFSVLASPVGPPPIFCILKATGSKYLLSPAWFKNVPRSSVLMSSNFSSTLDTKSFRTLNDFSVFS